ncbi:MAG TPA: GNAT family N-acetyltransferase [Pyrinomonadaceae bacterium]|jgi:ribosomal-protein-alanine N-acetyltransferase
MTFQIETERLLLRDVRRADLPALLAQAREPEARRGILAYQADENYNRVSLLAAIAEARNPRRLNYTLAVVRKSDAALIGSCSIANVRHGSIETSLGWHYGKRYWNKGYATEAARVLLHIGFEIGGVAEIYADCFVDNYASIRVMQKIGMTARENLKLFNQIRGWSYGENRPTVRHTITKNEWRLKANSE